jgi:hypothetical protein
MVENRQNSLLKALLERIAEALAPINHSSRELSLRQRVCKDQDLHSVLAVCGHAEDPNLTSDEKF